MERGPSEESLARAFLSHAARDAAGELDGISDSELNRLWDELVDLPAMDLSLQVELPKLVSPAIERLCDALADDDVESGRAALAELLPAIDTSLERARIARAVVALRAAGKLDSRLAAAALIDLASDSDELVGASLMEAIAVRAGAARTPAGILLAA